MPEAYIFTFHITNCVPWKMTRNLTFCQNQKMLSKTAATLRVCLGSCCRIQSVVASLPRCSSSLPPTPLPSMTHDAERGTNYLQHRGAYCSFSFRLLGIQRSSPPFIVARGPWFCRWRCPASTAAIWHDSSGERDAVPCRRGSRVGASQGAMK